ncbi:MAG: S8 family serine peptidase [Candidatus Bathyarchaeota archaeon]
MVERKPVIVTFKEKADPDIVQKSAEKAKVSFYAMPTLRMAELAPDVEPESLGIVIESVNAVSASLPDSAIEDLKKNPRVESVEPDGEIYAFEQPALMDPTLRPELLPIDRRLIFPLRCGYTDAIPWGVDRIDAERAWEVTQGKGIKVAVVDTGIDYTHLDLRPNYRGGISFVPTERSPMDYNRHGTHVSGTIAAARNCLGVVGVAPSAYLYAVKVLNSRGSGMWSYLLAGLEWCVRNRMDVVNMSLGASTAPTIIERICDFAYRNNILLVAAAGNTGGAVGYPARYRSVIAVSATTASNTLAAFSSRGPEVELCAPGDQVYSTLPGNKYGILSGTSMAAPHVTGVGALAISSHRYAIPMKGVEIIRKLLCWTADNLGLPGRDPLYGYGLVDAEQASFERRLPP